MTDYVARNRESWTRSNAEYTAEHAAAAWAQSEITWGTTQTPEADVRMLPEAEDKDVVELGCGTAYFGAWLKRAGARRVVGVDVTPAQLETARRLNEETGRGLELVEANAEETGLPSEAFDLAVSEYGASIWCDPDKWIAEVARLLRPGGELVFLRNSTLAVLCWGDDDTMTRTLQRPQRGLHRVDWEDDGTTEFHLGHGDWFRILRVAGFDVVDLVELFASPDAMPHTYYSFDPEWAKQWPWEEIWRARKLA